MVDIRLMYKIVFAQLCAGRDVNLSITGDSMLPMLCEGDIVTIRRAEAYSVGDILVYLYKGKLLIHRLLKIEKGRYFCKGDNSFRLEDFTAEDIAGKVILRNGKEIVSLPSTFIALSLAINKVFRRNGYNVEKTKLSDICCFYHRIMMNEEDNAICHQKNMTMDYIFADETSLLLWDPNGGDIHLFDENGTDILSYLKSPRDIEMLFVRLHRIRDTVPSELRLKVKEFLFEAIAKKE